MKIGFNCDACDNFPLLVSAAEWVYDPNQTLEVVMANTSTGHSTDVTIDDIVTTVVMARVTDFFGFFVYAIASALEKLAIELGVQIHTGCPVKQIIVDGENGYLFDENDTATQTQQVRDLVKHPAKRRQFGRAARETMQSLGWTAIMDELFTLYWEMIVAKGDVSSSGLQPASDTHR